MTFQCHENWSSHQRFSIKKVFLEILQNSTLAQVFSCEFLRTPFLQNSSGLLFLWKFVLILPSSNLSLDFRPMKFGRLIKCNNRNIFLQKLRIKWVRETSSKPYFDFWKSFIWGRRKWSVLCQTVSQLNFVKDSQNVSHVIFY